MTPSSNHVPQDREAKRVDLLLRNGRVYTMDAQSTVADAILIREGRIAAVGTLDEVAACAHPDTAELNLKSAAVVPGLLDTHPHLLHYGLLEDPLVPIWDCRDHDEIITRIARRAAELRSGEWLQASPIGEPHFFHRRSYRDLREGCLPNRWVLDRASTRHPIVIQAWAPVRPNCMALNSLALQCLGITRDTPERVGDVFIDRDESGEPTGLVTGSIINYYGFDPFGEELWRKLPFPDFARLTVATSSAMRRYHRQGVTGVYENHMMEPALIEAYRQLRRDGDLRMRVLVSQEAESYGTPWSQTRADGSFEALLEEAARAIVLDDALLRFNGLTVMWDGYCFGGAQMMRAPYLDVYGRLTRGHRHITSARAERVMRFCAERRLGLNLLVMGTRAHDEVLALLESIAEDYDIPELAWVLVHATTIEPDQVRRYRRLNFSCTTSMGFAYGEGDLLRRTMGARMLEDLVPLRRLIDGGMPPAGGTDWGPKNPWEQIHLALTHEFGESGYRNLGANQRIARVEALAMFTRNAAQVMRWPDIGTIARGHRADLAVIDRDPVTCEVDALKDTRVLRTIFDGVEVYDSGQLD